MQTIGLIGGVSWESSSEYYRLINQAIQKELGGVHSAKIVFYSFDFEEIKDLQHAHKWSELSDQMVQAAQKLKVAGADFIVICSNTMHITAEGVSQKIDIPLLHIGDPTGEAIRQTNIRTVGLLGTNFTMEQKFYRDRLEEKFGLKVLIPDDAGRSIVHSTIYNELVKGIISDASREQFKLVINDLVEQGAEAIILGCTEIMLLVKEEDSPVPIFDTTTLHAQSAAKMALTPLKPD